MGFITNLLRGLSSSSPRRRSSPEPKVWCYFYSDNGSRIKDAGFDFASKADAREDAPKPESPRGRVVFRRCTRAEYERIFDSNVLPRAS